MQILKNFSFTLSPGAGENYLCHLGTLLDLQLVNLGLTKFKEHP